MERLGKYMKQTRLVFIQISSNHMIWREKWKPIQVDINLRLKILQQSLFERLIVQY